MPSQLLFESMPYLQLIVHKAFPPLLSGALPLRANSKFLFFKILASLFLLFPFSGTASAENHGQKEAVEAYGISFPVDRVISVDNKNKELTLRGETTVVSGEQLPRFLAKQYFAKLRESSSFSLESLERFILLALQKEDVDSASYGLRAVFFSRELEIQRVANLVERMKPSPLSREVFKRVLGSLDETTPNPQFIAPLLYQIGVTDLDWMRSKASRWIYLLGENFRGYLQGRLFSLMLEKNFAEVDRLLNLTQAMFGEDDVQFRKLGVLANKAKSVIAAGDEGGVEVIAPILDLTFKDPSAASVFEPLLNDYVGKVGSRLIEKGRPDEALRLVGKMNFERRTPSLHKIVFDALRQIQPSQLQKIENPTTVELLERFSAKDTSIRDAYVNLLKNYIVVLIDRDDFIQAEEVFRRMQKLKPDPSQDNNEARFLLAREAMSRGHKEKAMTYLEEIGDGLSALQNIEVLLRKIYLRLSFFAVVILFCIFAGALAFSRWPKFTTLFRIPKKPQLNREEDEEEDAESPFVKNIHGLWNPHLQEYYECLEYFHLKPGATAREIKTAHRLWIKKFHPDLREEDHSIGSEKFLEAQGVYERLLKLENEYAFSKRGVSTKLDE